MDAWRRRALAIPDAPIREDALSAIATQALPHRGRRTVLDRAASAGTTCAWCDCWSPIEVLLDYLDSATSAVSQLLGERTSAAPGAGRGARARRRRSPTTTAITRGATTVATCARLCSTCRECCADAAVLRARVRPLAVRGAARAQRAGPEPRSPTRTRRERARCGDGRERSSPDERELSWWELSAAASSTLGVHALLALAADPALADDDVREVDAAYMPWVCAASTMLDSYVDQAIDVADDEHSYVAHYSSPAVAARRVCELVRRSARRRVACTAAIAMP